jgi:hypothetical protein
MDQNLNLMPIEMISQQQQQQQHQQHSYYNQQQFIASCNRCHEKIEEKYIFNVANRFNWHSYCLNCCECGIELRDTCFLNAENKIFCKNDYLK